MAPFRPTGASEPPPAAKGLSTGQIAKLFSVTRDTVLKWIKQGRLSAHRTAGGHYRVTADQVQDLLGPRSAPDSPGPVSPSRLLRAAAPLRCWEFASPAGEPFPQCRTCLAYEAGASFCFQLRKKLPSEMAFACCGPAQCTDCPYYRRVRNLPSRLLLLGRKAILSPTLCQDRRWEILQTADPYEAAQWVVRFCPAVAVVDAGLGKTGREFVRRLLVDQNAVRARVLYVGRGRRPGFAAHAGEKVRWPKLQVLAGPLDLPAVESCLPPVPLHSARTKIRKESI